MCLIEREVFHHAFSWRHSELLSQWTCWELCLFTTVVNGSIKPLADHTAYRLQLASGFHIRPRPTNMGLSLHLFWDAGMLKMLSQPVLCPYPLQSLQRFPRPPAAVVAIFKHNSLTKESWKNASGKMLVKSWNIFVTKRVETLLVVCWLWPWLCVSFQVVIGYLHTSQRTGRLQLSDHTGSIDCVMGAWSSTTSESSATSHWCWSSSCTGGCPFIQTSLLGGVFRIDRFQLVVETFRACKADTTVVCPYIQFAAADILQLGGRPHQISSTLASASGQLPDSENVGNRQRNARIDRNGSTVSVVSRRSDCQNDSTDDMFASFSGSPSCQTVVSRCECSVYRLFVVDHCENMLLRSPDIEQLSLQFTATGYFVGPPKLSSCGCPKSAATTVPSCPTIILPVVAIFSSRAVRWYSVLHSACIYQLVLYSNDVSPFLGKSVIWVPPPKRTKLERNVERYLVVLDKNMDVRRITSCSPGYRHSTMSSQEEISSRSAVDDVSERLKRCIDFWQQQSTASSQR